MGRKSNSEKMWDWINREFEKWQKEYSEKEIPKKLSKKAQNKWLEDVFLAKDGENIAISGGGRILLWLAMREMYYPLDGVNTSWVKFIKYQEEKRRRDYILDAIKFQAREKILGIQLLKDPILGANPDSIIIDEERENINDGKE